MARLLPRLSAISKPKPKSTAKKAYVFFNCDGEKTPGSMNIAYNSDVYQDTKKARKELWEKILSEKNNVQLSDANMAAAEKEVLDGDPIQASQYLPYGAIVVVNIH